jgi:hypothetical protein
MLNSGPRSYYDEYVRKKGANRIISDPTSLMTDRGAYVNFLEVQLERVSAACLTAQSYEDRFNDMQTMIKTLEQRCGSNVKLIALAQQCTEVYFFLFYFYCFHLHSNSLLGIGVLYA